ncbi:MAG: phage tail sheath family protein, partial [Clostridiales bacterium]
MPVYLYPGVYVEEVPPLARPISGVGTSTAGFVGVVMDDVKMPLKPGSTSDNFTVSPVGKPQLITGWEQFKNNFGDFQSQKKGTGGAGGTAGWSDDDYKAYLKLQHAVYGFFNNGGTICWVIRVKTSNDLANLADLLNEFEPIDDIAIVAVPGAIAKEQQNAIIDHCENMMDRVAILDGNQATSFTVDAIKDGTRDSSYAALYFPWIKVFDPVSQTNISQPPSGHLAGIYAKVDAERGVYKAPANEIIRGAVDLDSKLSQNDQKVLNPKGINVVRAFNGNFIIWGARTLGGDANGEFRYISTRRD